MLRKTPNNFVTDKDKTNFLIENVKKYSKSPSCSFIAFSANSIDNTRKKSSSTPLIWAARDMSIFSSNITKKGRLSQKQKRDKKAHMKHKINQRRGKRLKYLETLTTKGQYDPTLAPKPDPERWIAKSQRSYAKRKNKTKFIGAQGSGNGAQKDSDKLDVAKRVQLQKEREEEKAKKEEQKKAELAARRKKASARRG